MRGPQSHPGGRAPPLRDQDSSVSAEPSLQGPGLGSTATPSVLRRQPSIPAGNHLQELAFSCLLALEGEPREGRESVPDTQGALGKIRPEDEQAPGLRPTPWKPDLATGCSGAGGGRRESPPSRTLACRVTSADVGSDPASAPVQLFDRQQTTSPLQTFISSPVNWGCSPASQDASQQGTRHSPPLAAHAALTASLVGRRPAALSPSRRRPHGPRKGCELPETMHTSLPPVIMKRSPFPTFHSPLSRGLGHRAAS